MAEAIGLEADEVVGEVRRLRVDSPPLDLVFSHESEQQVADLLDFYEIAWEYEPRTFVLEMAADGNPRTAFTPDFYLPDHDLYLEVTTLRQSLVTRKNRKVRLLRERHPGIHIRILYRRDLERLLVTHAA
ncbi:MAG: hypothetical protein VYA26_04635 [Actinomycetota bacterium]|nr:hypothetical protein [Actinomycetota bacterium]MED5393719.1 hypothetical protein [Actinomycetota bacterium]MEE3354564.1 hypothetical protein [Actinomycetota bacterium]